MESPSISKADILHCYPQSSPRWLGQFPLFLQPKTFYPLPWEQTSLERLMGLKLVATCEAWGVEGLLTKPHWAQPLHPTHLFHLSTCSAPTRPPRCGVSWCLAGNSRFKGPSKRPEALRVTGDVWGPSWDSAQESSPEQERSALQEEGTTRLPLSPGAAPGSRGGGSVPQEEQQHMYCSITNLNVICNGNHTRLSLAQGKIMILN